MSLYLSNALYLGTTRNDPSGFMRGAPLVGYQSFIRPQDLSSPNTGGSMAAAWSPDTYTFWRSVGYNSAGDISISLVMANPSASVINYVGIAGHNFFQNDRGIPVAFTIEQSSNGATWTEVYPPTIPTSGNAIFVVFDDIQPQYLRVRLLSPPAPTGPQVTMRVAHIRAGQVTRLQRRVYVGMRPFTLDKRATKVMSVSDGGKYLGSVVQSVVNAYELNQPDNNPAFVRTVVDPFLDHCDLIRTQGNGPMGTFFCAWRPLEYPNEVLYCHPPERIQRPTNQRPNGMMEWSISGEAESWLTP